MTYYHWASNPVRLRRMSYGQKGHPKPNGLWFDVNGTWKSWCESTEFRLENLRFRHAVKIVDTSRMLFLRRAHEIDAFTRKYGHNLSSFVRPLHSAEDSDAFAREYGRDLFGEIQKQFSNYILWEEVARNYTGIVIEPYSRSRSQTYLWYYGWNCAGGCIWDTSVIRLGRPCRVE
jgi:hypothetical protein